MTDPGSIPEEQTVLTLQVEADQADAFHDELLEMGFAPVEITKPGCPYCWEEMYFQSRDEALVAGKVFEGHPLVKGRIGYRVSRRRDWESSVRHHFRKMEIGGRLEVCPVWEAETPKPESLTRILVNPGLSFGTGNHFTTRFCLEMLTEIISRDPAVETFLDLGTGSGILAIAAVKLGVPGAVGVEVDPLALEQARENLALNGVEDAVTLVEQDVVRDPLNGTFDMVIANIYTAALLEIAPWAAASCRRHLLLTGIREFEADAVAETYIQLGGREVARDGDGEWAGLYLSWP